jgi:hypothetical protein
LPVALTSFFEVVEKMYKDIKFWNKKMALVSAYQIIAKTQFMLMQTL